MIVSEFGGEVPHTMDELTRLPGVGRKTANIVLNVSFGIVEGIAVDTHVNRIAHRLALSPKTHEKEPLKTEQDLLKILPREYWRDVNHQWIRFGREVCGAKAPRCGECPMVDLCPSATGGRLRVGRQVVSEGVGEGLWVLAPPARVSGLARTMDADTCDEEAPTWQTRATTCS